MGSVSNPLRPWEIKREEGKPSQGRRIVNKFYNSVMWRKIRARQLARQPLCEDCLRRGKTRPATEVDHIQPINPINSWDTHDNIWGDPVDESNLQSLCESCHARKSAREQKEIQKKIKKTQHETVK